MNIAAKFLMVLATIAFRFGMNTLDGLYRGDSQVTTISDSRGGSPHLRLFRRLEDEEAEEQNEDESNDEKEEEENENEEDNAGQGYYVDDAMMANNYDDFVKRYEAETKSSLWNMFEIAPHYWTPLQWTLFSLILAFHGVLFACFCIFCVLPRCCGKTGAMVYASMV